MSEDKKPTAEELKAIEEKFDDEYASHIARALYEAKKRKNKELRKSFSDLTKEEVAEYIEMAKAMVLIIETSIEDIKEELRQSLEKFNLENKNKKQIIMPN